MKKEWGGLPSRGDRSLGKRQWPFQVIEVHGRAKKRGTRRGGEKEHPC